MTKKYGSDERIVVRAAKSDIVCRAIMICLKAWDAGYRPEGRHPSQIKQDLAVAFAIRINCARGGKPVSAIQLRRRLPGLTAQNMRTSLAYLQMVGMVRRKRAGWIIEPDYIVQQLDAPYLRRMVAAIIHAGKQLTELKEPTEQKELSEV